ncbi:hypothetical protein [Nocardia blacklockiae]|uniref:hypothetical protein n=1 Tax=Nocardia blacklockiae TaxID=480036 RepID=UPI001894B218|nr:hypothetical protein [Nocardia blacklockiae]MBF6175013.1 hypothetical protein [Nocardia blacklockiae]
MDTMAVVEDLDVPVVSAAETSGLVVEIAAMDLEPPALTGRVLLHCADGAPRRVPTVLTDWAISMLAADRLHRRTDGTSLFPCRAEFRIVDGIMEVTVL